MKNSDKRRGKKAVEGDEESRKRFLQMLGVGALGAATIDGAFISQAFGASSMVAELPRAEVEAHLKIAASKSLHPEMVPRLEAALGKAGLFRVESIARVYELTSVAGVKKRITILPFHPEGKAPGKLASIVGSLGISEGSSPSAVTVRLNGTKVVSFTTHDVLFGKLVEKTITPQELQRAGAAHFVEKDLPRERVNPDISVEQSAGLAESTLRTLLAQEEKAGQYSPAQVQGFLTNLPSIRLMAQLQYARHKGLTMSPGNACCCCSSCCWGCCSCTSAVASSYLSERYRSRSAARRLSA